MIDFVFALFQSRDTKIVDSMDKRSLTYNSNRFVSCMFGRILFCEVAVNMEKLGKHIRFDCWTSDKIFIPLYIEFGHFTLLVIYMLKKEIRFFDSAGGNGQIYIDRLFDWLCQLARGNMAFKKTDWKFFSISSSPISPPVSTQRDSAVYVLINTLFLVDNLPLVFDHDNIDHFRKLFCSVSLNRCFDS